MTHLNQRLLLCFLLLSLIISNLVHAMPPTQTGSTVITPENADEVVNLGQYGNGRLIDLALSPDDTRLAVAMTTAVWVIELESGETVTRLEGHTDILSQVVWSPDGHFIATASQDQIIRVYSAESGDIVHSFTPFEDEINFIAFAPNGQYLLSAGHRADRTLRLWDTATGDTVWSIDFEGEIVLDAVFSPDGQHIIGAMSDYSVHIWNTLTGDEIRAFPTELFAEEIAITPDADTLLIVSNTNLLHAFDLETGTQRWQTVREDGSIQTIAIAEEINDVLAGTTDGGIRVLDIDTGQSRQRLGQFLTPPVKIVVSADGQTIYAGSDAVGVRGFDRFSGQMVSEFPDFARFRGLIPFSRDGATVVDQVGDTLVERDPISGSIIRTYENVHIPENGVASALPTNTHALIRQPVEDEETLWEHSHFSVVALETGETIFEFTPSAPHVLTSASPDGSYIAVALYDSDVEVWDVLEGMALPTLDVDGSPVDDTVSVSQTLWSPDSRQLLVIYPDLRTVLLWDVHTGTISSDFAALFGVVRDFIWWDDGSLIAVEVENQLVRLRDVHTESILHISTVPEPISHVAISPTFDVIAVGSAFGKAFLIDSASGTTLQTLDGHIGSVFATWSYDGATLMTTGEDSVIHLWGITLD